ncbi:hypothetical protein [Saccharicrinis sp. FJH54]|uniref:hypothetical protein n=1 Tax=Saccharicrinis sp. FJH54 TaxID=3344665 RepID=UPI0035D43B4E
MKNKVPDKRLVAATWCFAVAFFPLILYGLRYIFSRSFISYHEVALGTRWEDMPASFHILYLALLKVAGGGMLAAGLVGEILVFIPFRKNEAWSRRTLLITGLIAGGMALTATLTVKLNTAANPPWILTAVCLVLIITGFFLSFNSSNVHRT